MLLVVFSVRGRWLWTQSLVRVAALAAITHWSCLGGARQAAQGAAAAPRGGCVQAALRAWLPPCLGGAPMPFFLPALLSSLQEFAHCMVAVVPRVSECMVDTRPEA